MARKIIIPIHGIMMMDRGYSLKWKEVLNPPAEYEWLEYFWDKINDRAEKHAAWMPEPFRFLYLKVVDHLFDAIRYNLQGKKKKAISNLQGFILKNKDADEIIILAHSLGSVLSYEGLSGLPLDVQAKIKLVTFGSPLSSSFERWFLGVKDNPIYPAIWINLYGDWRDFVGGRPLRFSNFDPKNDYFFPVSHDEFQYLKKAKSLIHKLFS